jgi:hypothetical protein
VRTFVRDGGDDRDMIIGPARDRNVRGLSRRRVAAFGGDQQGRGEQAPVLERDPHAAFIADRLAGPGRHQQLDPLRVPRGVAQRGTEQAVLDHRAERILHLSVEQDAARLQSVADPDGADRTGAAFEPFGDADRLQHPPGRARHRRRAAVIGRRVLGLGIGRIDDDRAKAVPVERQRQAETDQPAAEDDDVRALHFLPVAMQSRNAKRLTGESRRAH